MVEYSAVNAAAKRSVKFSLTTKWYKEIEFHWNVARSHLPAHTSQCVVISLVLAYGHSSTSFLDLLNRRLILARSDLKPRFTDFFSQMPRHRAISLPLPRHRAISLPLPATELSHYPCGYKTSNDTSRTIKSFEFVLIRSRSPRRLQYIIISLCGWSLQMTVSCSCGHGSYILIVT